MSVRWRSHPLIDEFPRSLLCIAAIGGACAATYVAFDGLSTVLTAAAVLSASLAPYLLPTTYELDDQGVTVRFLGTRRYIPWSRIRRVVIGRRGMLVSEVPQPSRRASFKSIVLRFNANPEEVIAFVRSQHRSSD